MTSTNRARIGWSVAALLCAAVFVFVIKAILVDQVLCHSDLEDAKAGETLRQAAFRLRMECTRQPATRASFQHRAGTVWLVEHTGYASIQQAFDAGTGRLTYQHICGDVID